jgi:DNA-binding LytR/AlgR family response regulator
MKNNNILSIVLLDDDDASLLYMKQLVKTSRIANEVAAFKNPLKFIEEFPKLNFDLLMLDIDMPAMSGKDIIKRVGRERCIVNTGSQQKFEEAIKCHPIDILIKPAKENHFKRALEKAQKILLPNPISKEHFEFRTSGSPNKLNLKVKNIIYVSTHKDPRNKIILMQDGTEHILTNYKMKELLKIAPHLLQPNPSELVSIDIISAREYDHVFLRILNTNKKQKMVSVGRSFLKKFNLHYSKL